MSPSVPSLPIRDVRFNGEFRRDSALVVLTWGLSRLTQCEPGRTDVGRLIRHRPARANEMTE